MATARKRGPRKPMRYRRDACFPLVAVRLVREALGHSPPQYRCDNAEALVDIYRALGVRHHKQALDRIAELTGPAHV